MRYVWPVILLLCSVAQAGDIRLPMRSIEVTPDPVSETRVEPVDTLPIGELFIVESDAELIVRQCTSGLLTVREIAPGGIRPIGIDGLFAGGDRGGETRVFTGAHVYSFRGIRPGKLQVNLIPKGVLIEHESDAPLLVLTVSGQGPKPPPEPEPIPPDDDPLPTVKNVSIAIVEDTMNRSPDTAILMNQLVAWTEFVDAGNDWRAYALTTGEARGKQAIADLNGPVPGIVIYEKTTRKMIHRGDLPATFAELKSIIGRLTGGN